MNSVWLVKTVYTPWIDGKSLVRHASSYHFQNILMPIYIIDEGGLFIMVTLCTNEKTFVRRWMFERETSKNFTLVIN